MTLPNGQMNGTLMAVESVINSKNPKTLSLRKLLDTMDTRPQGITKKLNHKAKAALEDDLLATEKYPLQDLINWIKTENMKTRKTRWKNCENNVKNR
jgi:hypothetical protein